MSGLCMTCSRSSSSSLLRPLSRNIESSRAQSVADVEHIDAQHVRQNQDEHLITWQLFLHVRVCETCSGAHQGVACGGRSAAGQSA